MFFIIINQTWLLVLGRLVYPKMQLLQNCFVPSNLLLQDLIKFDLVYDDRVSLQKTIWNFQKRPLLLGQMGHFTQFSTSSSSIAGKHFLKMFAYRIHIIRSRPMKCKTYGTSFFDLRVLYCSYPKFVLSIWPSAYCHRPEYVYLICLYSLTLNLTWWDCAIMSWQQWRIHIFQRRSLFVAN